MGANRTYQLDSNFINHCPVCNFAGIFLIESVSMEYSQLFMVKNVLIDSRGLVNIYLFVQFCSCTAQKLKFPIKDFFSKCDQTRCFLRIWSHLLNKSLMENFIFYAVLFPQRTGNYNGNVAAKWYFYYTYFILTLWLGRGLLITGSSTRASSSSAQLLARAKLVIT